MSFSSDVHAQMLLSLSKGSTSCFFLVSSLHRYVLIRLCTWPALFLVGTVVCTPIFFCSGCLNLIKVSASVRPDSRLFQRCGCPIFIKLSASCPVFLPCPPHAPVNTLSSPHQ